jgi:hypothetical protein
MGEYINMEGGCERYINMEDECGGLSTYMQMGDYNMIF